MHMSSHLTRPTRVRGTKLVSDMEKVTPSYPMEMIMMGTMPMERDMDRYKYETEVGKR